MSRLEPGPLGLLGGTFDPVHRAHLHLARAALKQLHLAGVTWIPAGQPALRDDPCAPAAHRVAMVRLAIAADPAFALDATDACADAPSYTVPTLERLRREHGTERPLVLLLGADAFLGLPGWHRWRELFDLAHLAIAARPGAHLRMDAMHPVLGALYRERHGGMTDLTTAPAGAIVRFNIEPVQPPDLSATMVRERLRAAHGEGAADLLSAGVLDYIARHGLYSSGVPAMNEVPRGL